MEKSTKKLANHLLVTCTSKILEFRGKTYSCAIGKNGFTDDKIEGDNKTPLGEFSLLELKYRADKYPNIKTGLITSKITENQGWCDDPEDKNYNCQVELPYPTSHEKLYRDDNLYDIVIVISHNQNPVSKNKGSAIFIHIAKENYSGTEGCIALKSENLLEIAEHLNEDTKIVIQE